MTRKLLSQPKLLLRAPAALLLGAVVYFAAAVGMSRAEEPLPPPPPQSYVNASSSPFSIPAKPADLRDSRYVFIGETRRAGVNGVAALGTGGRTSPPIRLERRMSASASLEPIDAVLNIKVLDRSGSPRAGLVIDVGYFFGQGISGTMTDENGIASFDVSTEMLYEVNVDPDGADLIILPVAIPSDVGEYTYTVYLYGLAENESSIRLARVDGSLITDTAMELSLDDSPVWAGSTDSNGVAVVPDLASGTCYEVAFDQFETTHSNSVCNYWGAKHYAITPTPNGTYGRSNSSWFRWTDMEPEEIYQPGVSTELTYSPREVLPGDTLIHAIVRFPTISTYSYDQSIHDSGSDGGPVDMPDLPTGYYTLLSKLERAGSIRDVQTMDFWIYDSSSHPDYDISISYPSVAANNELTVDITILSDADKTVGRRVQDNIGGGAGWGSYIRPGQTISDDPYPQPEPGPDGYINYTIVLYDGPQVWHKLIDDVQATDPAYEVSLTINATYVEGPPGPVTFTVDSTADAVDATPGDGACDDGTGSCTLRAAITEANVHVGKDTIAFDIPGPGPHSIQPLSGLPTITDPVIIDGYTQPGASPNTNGPGLGLNTVLKIELDGSGAGSGVAGLDIAAGNSTVRGLVINRFSGNGIVLDTSGGNVVEGDFIGTDVTGTAALSNSQGIIISGASTNTIGGTTAEARNVISGNDGPGVLIRGSGSTGNLVQGNYIGTDVNGTIDLGNSSHGVTIESGASNNAIGGATPGARNVISANGAHGVVIGGPSTGNSVQGNSIFSNGALGIDLGNDGVTPNDTGDGDTGANNLQNFPELTSATSGATSTTIEGTLDSTDNTTFKLEFSSNTACDPSGNGEGEAFLGFTDVTTDSSGDATFMVTFPTTVPAGQFITATATDTANNTSEFSQCRSVVAGAVPLLFIAGLVGAQEVPPVGTPATGLGLFSFDAVQTELDFSVAVDLDALIGPVTAAHFHGPAPIGANAGAIRTICATQVDCATGFTGGTATGTWRATDPQALTPGLVDALLAGDLYVNVHTSVHPGGEIRGQIVPLICGDLNNDGDVNVFDAIIGLQIIVGLIEPAPDQLVLSDLNGDGTTNVFDAILLLQDIVGLTEITECGT